MSASPILNNTDAAYAAGFFDGEGHIRITRHSTRCNAMMLQVNITQATEMPLDWFMEKFGGTVRRDIVLYKGNKKVRYLWQASSASAERVIRTVLPYLKNKADEAIVALEFRARSKGVNHNRQRLSDEEVAARVELMKKLKTIRFIKHNEYLLDSERSVIS